MKNRQLPEITSLVWFTRNLRTGNNEALSMALRQNAASHRVFALFVDDPSPSGPFYPGAAARWYMQESLQRLQKNLALMGVPLLLRRGNTRTTVLEEVRRLKADHFFYSAAADPAAASVQKDVHLELIELGVASKGVVDQSLVPLGQIRNKAGTRYRVFSPFWKALKNQVRMPSVKLSTHPPLPPIEVDSGGAEVREFFGSPPSWAAAFYHHWHPGEQNAHTLLNTFLKNETAYCYGRDALDRQATSRLSAALNWGELTPLEVWGAVCRAEEAGLMAASDAEAFRRQLGWRQFAQETLHAYPQIRQKSYNTDFEHFPWHENETLLQAWKNGQTGYPLVDAAMRELWQTGGMHNRARMVTASFLCKHLLQPWQAGAAWFADTLVDAHPALNLFGWQWAAGCGLDSAPYFRIFNPTAQGERFDPRGGFVRRWCPALNYLPDKYVHRPFEAPAEVLDKAGIILGQTYPQPLVIHKEARVRALDAYALMKARALKAPPSREGAFAAWAEPV